MEHFFLIPPRPQSKRQGSGGKGCQTGPSVGLRPRRATVEDGRPHQTSVHLCVWRSGEEEAETYIHGVTFGVTSAPSATGSCVGSPETSP